VAERIRKQQEEEARIRALEEEEARKIAEEDARIAEEERKAEEERERKKQLKKEKLERQKKAGTYMTKAQKAKAKLAEERLAAMKAAGMLPQQTSADACSGGDDAAGGGKGRAVHDNRKRGKGKGVGSQQLQQEVVESKSTDEDEVEDAKDAEKEEDTPAAKPDDDKGVGEAEGGAEDKDEDEDSGDDWDAGSDSEGSDKFDDLADRLKQVKDSNEDDEDLIEIEKKKEKERLRELGLKRAEQDRIEAEKRALLMAEQEEANRAAALLAQKREEGRRKRVQQEKTNLAARSPDELRCPIVVIMGHVDTGKTKLLDKIRKTNVQEGEAGGITQQIGATFFERKTLETQTARLNETEKVELKVPGMLVIDTPGHESFTNLRSRGSSLCDIAILVVDLMHGLEQQTIESLTMLTKRGVPFVVALNKVDRCYGWKTHKDTPIREALKDQPEGTISEFRSRCADAKLQLQEQGINSNIYWEMGDDDWSNSDFIPLVPTSAITGEGVQDLLLLLCQISQRKLTEHVICNAPCWKSRPLTVLV
jgi:translation initiation factor 5B